MPDFGLVVPKAGPGNFRAKSYSFLFLLLPTSGTGHLNQAKRHLRRRFREGFCGMYFTYGNRGVTKH
jgi:hypothetical protein